MRIRDWSSDVCSSDLRDREVVLQPILRSPVTVSSAGVSREYLEMITRDTVVLTLNRSPQNLEYWMNAVLDITAPASQGKVKADLLKIVNEQRGSSISQFFTIEKMEDRKSTRLNSSHYCASRMPYSA